MESLSEQHMKSKIFLIPYIIETDFVRFVSISHSQYLSVKKLTDNGTGGLSQKCYMTVLESFLTENMNEILDICIISHKFHNHLYLMLMICFILEK